MAIEQDNNQKRTEDPDSYGGSRNRLSYEKLHGEKQDDDKTDWTTRLGLFFIIFAIFALIGIWIVWYFDSELTRIFSQDRATDDPVTVQQTYIVSEIDE